MTLAPTVIRDRVDAAVGLLRAGRHGDAAALLRSVIDPTPSTLEARRLLAVALRDLGDLAGAEQALGAAIAIDPGQPAFFTLQGDVLARMGRAAEAEAAYRRALALSPTLGPAAVGLAELLLAAERWDEALAVTSAAVAAGDVDLNVWTAHGMALKAQRRLDEAIEAYRRGAEAAPRSAVAEHNLAAALGDAERFAESEAATRRAFAKGLHAPEAWLVHGRALMGQAKLDAAEAAFREALRRRPADLEPLTELAQLVWMRSGDLATAAAPIDEAERAAPGAPAPRLVRAKLLEYAGDAEGAYAEVAALLADAPADFVLQIRAAQLLAERDPGRALAHAQAAAQAAPQELLA
ncbi:MAG TPA: tetratricopeptide repeat protein, partial [Caulobacteraceae bacterium]